MDTPPGRAILRQKAASAKFLSGMAPPSGPTLLRKDHRLPVILSPQEVLQLLQAAPSFTHHVIFSTVYGTGMRVSEAVHLRAASIDSQRMMIRIELSKGHKDRDVQLSAKLLGAALLLAENTARGMDVSRRNSRSPFDRFAVADAVVRAASARV